MSGIIAEDSSKSDCFSEEILSHTLFERLILENPQQYLINTKNVENYRSIIENGAIIYLFESYNRLEEHSSNSSQDECEKIRNLIATNTATCLTQPDLFQNDSNKTLSQQFMDILEKSYDLQIESLTIEFLVLAIKKMKQENSDELETLGALKAIFYPLLSDLQKQISLGNMITLKKNTFPILTMFVKDKRIPEMGEVLIDYTTPNPQAKGRTFEEIFVRILQVLYWI